MRRHVDLLIAVVMLVMAYLLRRDGLPRDGLWFDDAWVATGALKSRLGDAVAAGSAHPGFTAWLRIQHKIFGGGLPALAYPALAAGCLGPPLLYLGLRQFKIARSVCMALAAALLVSHVHVMYSGRVKSYTIDVLVMTLLLVLVPRLAEQRWKWSTAVLWLVGALAMGSMSGYATVATAAATTLLVLHPSGDRALRSLVLVLQGVVQGTLYLLASRAADLHSIERFMEVPYDGHITFSRDPWRFANESLSHLARVADVFPGGSTWVLPIIGVIGVAGLVVESIAPTERRRGIAARLGLALLTFAYVGSILGRFPFGPTTRSYFWTSSPGGRHTLWTVPIMALGLALVLDRFRSQLSPFPRWRLATDVTLVAVAAGMVVSGWGRAPDYVQPGGTTATRLVERELADGATVLLLDTKVYVFAASTSEPVRLIATPDHMIGFTPEFTDPHIVGLGSWSRGALTPHEVHQAVQGTRRVIVYSTLVGPNSDKDVRPLLLAEGFQPLVLFWQPAELVTAWTR